MLTRSARLVTAAAAAVVAITACLAVLPGCGSSPASPGVNPEIVNLVDHFSYQVSTIQNHSSTTSFTWSNSGTQATINQSCSVTAGAATLVVLDGTGAQVYARSLADNGTFTTASGTPGTWTIRLVYDGVSATVNFRADVTT